MRRIIVVGAIAALCVACACSRQESGWQHAAREDTAAAYQAYLERFPAGAHAGEARKRLAALEDEEAWARAMRLGTPEAWQRYLGERPRGRHAMEAEHRLAEFVPPAARAPPAPAADYMVQLGAYSSEVAARRALERILREHGDMLGAAAPRIFGPSASVPGVWRVRAGPFGEREARETCATLLAAGTGCVPVTARSSAGEPAP